MTALAMDAGRTLLFDRARVIEAADAAGIAIEAFPLEAIGVAETTGDTGEVVSPGIQPRKKIRVAVVGAGDFGRNHARVYRELADAELVGIVDADPARAAQVAQEFSTEVFPDIESLAGRVDAASVAVPTVEHARVGCRLLELGIDVLVEKPMAASLAEADRADCRRVARRAASCKWGTWSDSIPAIVAVMPVLNRPLYFEVHRLGVFTPRSLDIDVVYDVMIHDLDILLALVDAPVDGHQSHRHSRADRQSGHRARAPGFCLRRGRQRHRQPRLHRARAQAALLPAARIYFRGFHAPGCASRARGWSPARSRNSISPRFRRRRRNRSAPSCARSWIPCARAALRWWTARPAAAPWNWRTGSWQASWSTAGASNWVLSLPHRQIR